MQSSEMLISEIDGSKTVEGEANNSNLFESVESSSPQKIFNSGDIAEIQFKVRLIFSLQHLKIFYFKIVYTLGMKLSQHKI